MKSPVAPFLFLAFLLTLSRLTMEAWAFCLELALIAGSLAVIAILIGDNEAATPRAILMLACTIAALVCRVW